MTEVAYSEERLLEKDQLCDIYFPLLSQFDTIILLSSSPQSRLIYSFLSILCSFFFSCHITLLAGALDAQL